MRRRTTTVVLLTFLGGALFGVTVAKKVRIGSDSYVGKEPVQAAAALLEYAKTQAGRGSWENIHVARVYYLSGQVEEAQAILDGVLTEKAEAGDWIRAGRLYFQAGEWDKAKKAFDRVLANSPKDEDWLAEIGAYYNLSGEREKAEELFQRSFSIEPALKNTLNAAGSYVGVTPRRR